MLRLKSGKSRRSEIWPVFLKPRKQRRSSFLTDPYIIYRVPHGATAAELYTKAAIPMHPVAGIPRTPRCGRRVRERGRSFFVLMTRNPGPTHLATHSLVAGSYR